MKSKNLLKNEKVSNKGITLIALVITIIVLLILAGVSIAMLTGENGVLTQASNAKERNEIAEVKEQAKLDIMAWRANEIANGNSGAIENDAKVKSIIEEANTNVSEKYYKELTDTGIVTENGYIILYSDLYTSSTGGNNEAVVGEKVTGSENKTYTNNGTAVIPVGFTIVPGLDDVSKGLVISDNENDTEADENNIVANGNQFVWIPVSKENFATEFVRHDFGNENIADEDFVSGEPTSSKYAELTADGITVDETASSSEQEVQKMYKSVKDNGGFYIGRYEAGNDGSNNVLCKKGVDVYNNIGWADSNDMTNETGGAVEKARGFGAANNYTSVTSTLVYGVQWDAVMRWINEDSSLQGYLTDSSPVGNYSDSDDTNNPAQTGAVKEYQLKNIYDMAGNVAEWTMESYTTQLKAYGRVDRGASYNENGAWYPVSCRNRTNPSVAISSIGFRVALYL